jgi:hypothetical protein
MPIEIKVSNWIGYYLKLNGYCKEEEGYRWMTTSSGERNTSPWCIFRYQSFQNEIKIIGAGMLGKGQGDGNPGLEQAWGEKHCDFPQGHGGTKGSLAPEWPSTWGQSHRFWKPAGSMHGRQEAWGAKPLEQKMQGARTQEASMMGKGLGCKAWESTRGGKTGESFGEKLQGLPQECWPWRLPRPIGGQVPGGSPGDGEPRVVYSVTVEAQECPSPARIKLWILKTTRGNTSKSKPVDQHSQGIW